MKLFISSLLAIASSVAVVSGCAIWGQDAIAQTQNPNTTQTSPPPGVLLSTDDPEFYKPIQPTNQAVFQVGITKNRSAIEEQYTATALNLHGKRSANVTCVQSDDSFFGLRCDPNNDNTANAGSTEETSNQYYRNEFANAHTVEGFQVMFSDPAIIKVRASNLDVETTGIVELGVRLD